jgi:hypothetical protein
MTQDEIKALELEALIEDLRLNHKYCPKEVILQAADELERLSQRTEQNFCPRCGKRTNDIHTCTPPQRTWVGLTADEQSFVFDQVKQIVDSKPFWVRFADAIESKLKERNNA